MRALGVTASPLRSSTPAAIKAYRTIYTAADVTWTSVLDPYVFLVSPLRFLRASAPSAREIEAGADIAARLRGVPGVDLRWRAKIEGRDDAAFVLAGWEGWPAQPLWDFEIRLTPAGPHTTVAYVYRLRRRSMVVKALAKRSIAARFSALSRAATVRLLRAGRL